MPLSHLRLTGAAALGTLALGLTSLAHAQPSHCPPGHAKKGWCEQGVRYDRGAYEDRRYDRDRYEAQRAYEEGYRQGREDSIRYGDRYFDDYRVIRDYQRYGLSAPRQGSYYAQLPNDEIVLVSLATQVISQFLGN